MKTRFRGFWLTAAFSVVLISNAAAAPLLQIDFGRLFPNPMPGFTPMVGDVTQATASQTFGSYSVNLTGQGFFRTNSSRLANTASNLRPLYGDYYYNNSTVNGDGVLLSIGGLTPSTPYNLRVWSYNDPENSALIQVTSTTGTLDLFGTTTSGGGGTRLNAFRLDDGTNELLAVDFGLNAPTTTPLQTGFNGIYEEGDKATYSQAVGAYTISLTGQGFWQSRNATLVNSLDASVRDFYSDYFYNNSTVNGEGVALTIDGVAPNTDYDLTLWSYDVEASTIAATPTFWSPFGATTGTTATIDDIRTPLPATLYDPDNSKTIRVRSTGTKLEIFGTSTGGVQGTRLNGFELNAVVTAHAGDFDGDGDVDGADFVAWQTHFPTATGATLADGDADGDGDVDGADFVVWQTNFPFTPAPGSAVPEPSTWFGCATALPVFVWAARRKHFGT
jgi:hypothetical protein